MDFALFDAENDISMKLLVSGTLINKQTNPNPVIGIANYIFDTLRHDAFRINNDGKIQEGLITVWSEAKAEPDLNDPGSLFLLSFIPSFIVSYRVGMFPVPSNLLGLLKRMKHRWSYRDLPHPQEYYNGSYSDIAPVLSLIQKRGQRGQQLSTLIPVGGIACLRNFNHLSQNRIFFISGKLRLT